MCCCVVCFYIPDVINCLSSFTIFLFTFYNLQWLSQQDLLVIYLILCYYAPPSIFYSWEETAKYSQALTPLHR